MCARPHSAGGRDSSHVACRVENTNEYDVGTSNALSHCLSFYPHVLEKIR